MLVGAPGRAGCGRAALRTEGVACITPRRRRRRRGALMYGVVTHLRLRGPLAAAQACRVEGELLDPLPATPGFRGMFVIRTGEAEVTVSHVWDAQAAAEAAVERFATWVQVHLGHELAGPVERRAGRVLGARQA